jgi:hypothetical protein
VTPRWLAVVLLGAGVILVATGSVCVGMAIFWPSGSTSQMSQVGMISGSGGLLLLCLSVLLMRKHRLWVTRAWRKKK